MEEKYMILKSELENNIFLKLKKIEENILTKTSSSLKKDIQILTLVSEELDDVLLNWEASILSSVQFDHDDFSLDD